MISKKQAIKNLLKIYPFYDIFCWYTEWRSENKKIKNWEKLGCPNPPPQKIKWRCILQYKKIGGSRTFIETGTYFGSTILEMKNHFNQVYSIELDRALFDKAVKLFQEDKNVSLFCGDSGVILPQLIQKINEPILFWLDGHYSAGVTSKGNLFTPVSSELSCILSHPIKNHVILIDDAHCFNGKNDYPKLEEVIQLINNSYPHYQVKVDLNIIQIYPR